MSIEASEMLTLPREQQGDEEGNKGEGGESYEHTGPAAILQQSLTETLMKHY